MKEREEVFSNWIRSPKEMLLERKNPTRQSVRKKSTPTAPRKSFAMSVRERLCFRNVGFSDSEERKAGSESATVNECGGREELVFRISSMDRKMSRNALFMG